MTTVGGSYAGCLVVRVKERAVDGSATAAVSAALADAFGLSKARVVCLRGHTSRRKFYDLDGDETTLQARRDELLARAT